MKNWAVFLTVFFISLSLVLSIFILFFAYKPFQNIETKAEQFVLKEKLLATVTRSSTDSGAFILLDRRIETKSYGNEFLEALPAITIQKLSLSNMVLELENCYNSDGD